MKNIWKTAILGIASAGMLLLLDVRALPDARPQGPHDIFSHNDHLLISRSIAEGNPRSSIILAVDPKSTASIAKRIRSLGGSVRFEADELGYLRVILPSATLPSLEGLADVNLANISPPNQFDVELTDVAVRRNEQYHAPPNVPDGLPTPSAKTPKVNDFTGVGEVGAAQFIQAHPTFDGRGVRIAIFEPVESDLPYLQWARDIDGHRVPKIIERRYTSDPTDMDATTRRKAGWVAMRTVVHAHGFFHHGGHTYKAPRDSEYRFGILRLRDLWSGRYYHNTRHPHGTPYGGPLDYAVLWDQSRNLVWVDTNQDGNFAARSGLMDSSRSSNYGVLHLHTDFWNTSRFHVFDKPALAPDAFPFVVQTDQRSSEVAIFLSIDDHSAMVASSAAGSGFFNGAFDGMAPGAQLLSFDQGEDFPFTLESMILAAREGVDIMTLQFGVSYNFDSGRNVWDEIEHRIVQHYGVIIAVAADNAGPAMTTVDTPSTADGVFSIGGYVRGRRLGLLYGAPVSGTDYIADYSSRGPRGDGGFKPDFLAPTEWLAGTSSVAPHGILRRGVQLPTGYDVGGGTSQATPSAAGAIALLVSAAKQSHVAYTPELIRDALTESARVLTRYGAYEQGAGLINVPLAWEALDRLSRARPAGAEADPDPAVTADAPVVTVRSGELAIAGRGPGLYEREGWQPGMHEPRTLVVTRSGGPVGAKTYAVRWKQDDGTFQSAATLTLSENDKTEFPISIFPRTAGAHSAVLELVDPATGRVALRRLNTVVAADQFTAQNKFTIRHVDAVPHPGVIHYFVNVPPKTDLLRIAMQVKHSDAAQFFKTWTGILVDVHAPDGTKPSLENLLLPYHDGDNYARVFPKPMPGVWEIAINNETPSERYADMSRRTPQPPTHFEFTASVYAVRTLSMLKTGSGYRLELLNTEAPLHPRSSSDDLGVAKESSMTVSALSPRALVPVRVPKGASEVDVAVERLDTGGSSDASVYLFNCAKNVAAAQADWAYQGACEYKAGGQLSSGGMASTSLPAAGEGQLLELEPTPPPGKWIVVVDASEHITTPMRLRVVSIIKSPKFGSVITTAPHSLVDTGGRWIATIRTPRSNTNASGAYVHPTIQIGEADTISEILPKTMNAAVVLKAKPIVRHTYTPIWLTMPH